jgi:FkbM family methyltransferase
MIVNRIKKTNADISILEKISSFTKYTVKNRVAAFFMYYELYRNYLDVVTRIVKKKYPIQAILRNGYHVTLHDYEETGALTRFLYMAKNLGNNVEFDINEDKLTFLSLPYWNNDSKVTLYGSITNGDAVGVFFENIYGNIPVFGKTVIDIGANIADSSIYFALRGAKKVIGLEPFPKNYEMAKRNVESNNLSDKITLMLAGCAASQGFVTISAYDNDKSWVGSSLKNSSQGFKVPLLTLEDILKQNNLQNGELNILKMDCEGCEYESILSATRDTIRSFSHIQIEYHYGYKDLKYKLEENGFIVSVSKPQLLHPIRTSDWFYYGDIYAKLA